MGRGTGSDRLGPERRADDVPTTELSQSRRARTGYKYGLNDKLKTRRLGGALKSQ